LPFEPLITVTTQQVNNNNNNNNNNHEDISGTRQGGVRRTFLAIAVLIGAMRIITPTPASAEGPNNLHNMIILTIICRGALHTMCKYGKRSYDNTTHHILTYIHTYMHEETHHHCVTVPAASEHR
jgi:hypothetical protein